MGLLAKNPQAEAQQVKTAGVNRNLVSNRPETRSWQSTRRLQQSSAAKVGQEAGELITQARGANRQTV